MPNLCRSIAIAIVVISSLDVFIDLLHTLLICIPWTTFALLPRLLCGMGYLAIFMAHVGLQKVFPPGYTYWGLNSEYAGPVVYLFLWAVGYVPSSAVFIYGSMGLRHLTNMGTSQGMGHAPRMHTQAPTWDRFQTMARTPQEEETRQKRTTTAVWTYGRRSGKGWGRQQNQHKKQYPGVDAGGCGQGRRGGPELDINADADATTRKQVAR